MRGNTSFLWVCGLIVCLAGIGTVRAAQYDLSSGDSISQVLSSLQPGDTVVLHSGTYGHVWIDELHGTPDAWITFTGAEGEPRPLITYTDSDKNVIDVGNVSYVKFQGLEITGGGDGMKFGYGSTNHDVILENLKIHAVGNVAINASSIAELANLTVRDCELYHTGRVTGGHGEGMYLGVASGNYQPQVHDALIEHNYIHDLGGSHGDGVEIKHGCYNVIVQDNVFSVHFSCPSITVWGTYKDDPAFNNIIRRNFIWRPVDAGIQATGETTIENNVIIGAISRGLSIRNRDGDGKMQYMRIVNNTIYRADGDAAVSLYAWGSGAGGPGLVFANNAVFQYMPNLVAIKGAMGLEDGTFSGNVFYGQLQSSSLPATGLTLAGAPENEFLNTSINPGLMNFYPKSTSLLLNVADPAYVPWDDFNLQSRPFGAGCDVGAYEWSQEANPGWQLTFDFKDMDAVPQGPTPILSVDPTAGITLSAWPGQFTLPSSRTYTLTNTGTASLDWTASVNATWATLTATAGTLAPGDSTTVTLTLGEDINSLPAGHYYAALRLTNIVSGKGNKVIPVQVTVLSPARLAVTPTTGFGGTMMIGGFLMPWGQYTVTNTGDLPMTWTAYADQPWVSFTSVGSTLAPQAKETFYAYINYLSSELDVGTYTATITFDGSASSAGTQTCPAWVTMTWMGDINLDGTVDAADLLRLAAAWGTTDADMTYDLYCDLDLSWSINVVDLLILADNWGKTSPTN